MRSQLEAGAGAIVRKKAEKRRGAVTGGRRQRAGAVKGAGGPERERRLGRYRR